MVRTVGLPRSWGEFSIERIISGELFPWRENTATAMRTKRVARKTRPDGALGLQSITRCNSIYSACLWKRSLFLEHVSCLMKSCIEYRWYHVYARFRVVLRAASLCRHHRHRTRLFLCP
jgi:hypothetical protein